MSMSEERRKRQQAAQDDGGKTKKILLYVAIVALFVGAFLAGRYYRNHKYDSFAKCIAGKNARMYGLYWCPPSCKAAGVKLFPSWQFGAEPPKEGVLSLQDLSQKTGCSLP